MTTATDKEPSDAQISAQEARRIKRDEIDKQMAEQARRLAELEQRKAQLDFEAEEQHSERTSPTRKRKSDVLAEASPVKSKIKVIDNSLDVRIPEKRKLEFSKSLINKRQPAESLYDSKSGEPSSRQDRQTIQQDDDSLMRNGRKPQRPRHEEASQPFKRSANYSDARNAVSGPSVIPSSSKLALVDPRTLVSKKSADFVKKERELDTKPSRLSKSLISRRRQTNHDSEEGEGSPGKARFGKRDAEDLTVLEDLKTGPTEFGRDPEGMAEWTWVEPNSGINLRQRYLSHNDVQELMTSRYYLSPSRLYSVIRLSRDRQYYDVPLDSDWVTVAIVCGKSELKSINMGNNGRGTQKDDSDDNEDEDQKLKLFKNKEKSKRKSGDGSEEIKKKTRKFVTLRLCSLPTRASHRGTTVGGDSMLNLLLFEADSETRTSKNGSIIHHYRGGSGGAYEKWWKLDVGSVIGIIAPKVLKPWGKTNQAPNPHSHPLGLTPSSDEDIFHIGKSQDLGQCEAIKKDGSRCDDWIDKRISKHCEYHVHNSIRSGKVGRAEFASSTAGFELRAKTSGKAKDEFDPIRKTGLLPKNGAYAHKKLQFVNNAGGQAYIIGGTMVSGNRTAFADEFVHERMGREKGRKLKRRKDEQAEEEALQKLLDGEMASGTTGAKYLRAIHELNKDKSNEKRTGNQNSPGVEEKPVTGMPFKIETIRKIGFNPAAYNDPLQGLKVSHETSKTLDELRDRTRAASSIKLGKMSGQKRSSVINPLTRRLDAGGKEAEEQEEEERMVDLGTSDVEDNGDALVDLD